MSSLYSFSWNPNSRIILKQIPDCIAFHLCVYFSMYFKHRDSFQIHNVINAIMLWTYLNVLPSCLSFGFLLLFFLDLMVLNPSEVVVLMFLSISYFINSSYSSLSPSLVAFLEKTRVFVLWSLPQSGFADWILPLLTMFICSSYFLFIGGFCFIQNYLYLTWV